MIEHLKIRNFLKNRKLEIELDPHVTTLIGSNGAGKSSAIRAFLWLANNEPSGTKFISWGKKSVEVVLTIDGKTITRRKDKEGNVYLLGAKQFKAFGTGNVPDEIERLLNLIPECSQGQFNLPFWFHLTPGQVSRELNKIVDLSIIDKSLASAARGVKQASARLEVSKERLSDARKARKGLAGVPRMAEDLAKLEKLNKQQLTLASSIALGQSLLDQAAQHTRTIQYSRKAIKLGSAAIKAGVRVRKVKRRLDRLSDLVDRLTEAQKVSESELPNIDELVRLREKVVETGDQVGRLTALVDLLTEKQADQCRYSASYRDAMKKMKKLSKGKCPACGQAIPS